jgi:hypothetical protein
MPPIKSVLISDAPNMGLLKTYLPMTSKAPIHIIRNNIKEAMLPKKFPIALMPFSAIFAI